MHRDVLKKILMVTANNALEYRPHNQALQHTMNRLSNSDRPSNPNTPTAHLASPSSSSSSTATAAS